MVGIYDISLQTPWQADWQPELIGTLMYIKRRRNSGQEVLLIHKKTGLGAGKINAPGGKLQAGENLLECACREAYEEVGVQPLSPRCAAEMRFVEQKGQQWMGFAFVAEDFQGEPRESAEARPFWCDVDDIPYARMWPDDVLWLPQVLRGGPFLVGNFLFTDGVLLAHEFVDTGSIWETIQSG